MSQEVCGIAPLATSLIVKLICQRRTAQARPSGPLPVGTREVISRVFKSKTTTVFHLPGPRKPSSHRER